MTATIIAIVFLIGVTLLAFYLIRKDSEPRKSTGKAGRGSGGENRYRPGKDKTTEEPA